MNTARRTLTGNGPQGAAFRPVLASPTPRRWKIALPRGFWGWLGLSCLLFCGCREPQAKPASRPTANSPAPRTVRTALAAPRRVERSVIALGSVVAHQHATLSTKVAGRLQSIDVDLGSPVKAGQVLARLEARDYELKVAQAAAALAQARAVLGLPLEDGPERPVPERVSSVRQARALLDEAKANYDRVLNLSKEKILSPSEVDTANSAYLVALTRYEDTLEKVRQQEALIQQRRVEWELAKRDLAETAIVAPFAGGVQDRQADVGEYFAVGTPILTVVRLDPLCLRVEVPEREAAKVRLEQSVRFGLEGDTNAYQTCVRRVSPALDETTRMLVVEADVPNDGRFHPGCFARAEIVIDPEATALTIPAAAVVAFAGIEKAFVVHSGKAVERRIETGLRRGDWVEVVNGLAAGDEVVLDPGGLQTGHPVIAAAGGK